MGIAAQNAKVTMILRRRIQNLSKSNSKYPYDVTVTRNESEGFGFVIISASNQYYGSTIGILKYNILNYCNLLDRHFCIRQEKSYQTAQLIVVKN